MANKVVEQESDNFRWAFAGGGTSNAADCEYCGRVYFTDQCDDYDELKSKSARNKLYVESDDVISYTTAFGKQYIYGCPCAGIRKFEDMLLRYRSGILNYFKRNLEDERRGLEDSEADFKAFEKEV